jgi:hypothetical protein
LHSFHSYLKKKKVSGHAGHFTRFQVGGDNPKVEGEILQNQYAKQSHILLSL